MSTKIEKTDLARDALYTKVNTMADEKQDKLTPGKGIAIASDGTISVSDALPAQSQDTDSQFLMSSYDESAKTSTASWGDIPTDPLFACQWADHYLNDASWLRADTFSWQSGDVYVSAYNHLVSDIDGLTLQSETVNGVTVNYYRAEDKHKICLADQESNIAGLYSSTGAAWYYILDTTNKRFKLPRTQLGFVGTENGNENNGGNNAGLFVAGTDMTATQMYLYFYVGNAGRSIQSVDVGKLTDYINTTVGDIEKILATI